MSTPIPASSIEIYDGETAFNAHLLVTGSTSDTELTIAVPLNPATLHNLRAQLDALHAQQRAEFGLSNAGEPQPATGPSLDEADAPSEADEQPAGRGPRLWRLDPAGLGALRQNPKALPAIIAGLILLAGVWLLWRSF